MSERYTYAVARIRALEVSLFSNAVIDQLIACPADPAQQKPQALIVIPGHGWLFPRLPELLLRYALAVRKSFCLINSYLYSLRIEI